MNYLLFANPVTGSKILSKLMKIKSPSVVITTFNNIDSWKRIFYRLLTGKLTVEDKLRFFYKIEFYDYRMIKPKMLKKVLAKHNIEIGIITTFSYIIPKEVFELFAKGVFNFHPSLLPNHGGPDPFYWIINNKDEFTGTTCYKITEVLDNGDIFLQKKYKIEKYNYNYLFRQYINDVCELLPQLLFNYFELDKNKITMGRTIFDPKISKTINK